MHRRTVTWKGGREGGGRRVLKSKRATRRFKYTKADADGQGVVREGHHEKDTIQLTELGPPLFSVSPGNDPPLRWTCVPLPPPPQYTVTFSALCSPGPLTCSLLPIHPTPPVFRPGSRPPQPGGTGLPPPSGWRIPGNIASVSSLVLQMRECTCDPEALRRGR